ncbi:Glutathione peroxidase 2 [Thecaphora frezii]
MAQFYDLKALKPNQETYSFDQLKGKVVLIVNTASKCGYTPQFAELEELNKKYASEGLVVLGFPSNQFASQDPGNNDEIVTFCQRNYGVTFPIMAKSDVNGSQTNEVFAFLKSAKKGILGTEMIKWNFTKFLVDRQGNVVERYGSNTKPSAIAADIEKLLKQ